MSKYMQVKEEEVDFGDEPLPSTGAASSSSAAEAPQPMRWWQKGHRKHNKALGITHETIRLRNAKGRETPGAEQQRIASKEEEVPLVKRKRLDFSYDQMKKLMNRLWYNQDKWMNDDRDMSKIWQASDKAWVPASQVHTSYRPALQHLKAWDWADNSPYPGWQVIYAFSPGQFKMQCATTEQAKIHEERGGNAERVPYSKRSKGVPSAGPALDELSPAQPDETTPGPSAPVTAPGDEEEERALGNPLLVKTEVEDDDEPGQDMKYSYAAALHRWGLLMGVTGELADNLKCTGFSKEELQMVKQYLREVHWGAHRGDAEALRQDFDGCKLVLDMQQKELALAKRKHLDTGADADLQAARRQEHIVKVFDDILTSKTTHLARAKVKQMPWIVEEAASSAESAQDVFAKALTAAAQDVHEDMTALPQESLIALATLQELGVERHVIWPSMLQLYDGIDVLTKYFDSSFLHNNLPAIYAAEYDPMQVGPVQPVHIGDLSSAPTVLLLTSTNPRTADHWTLSHQALTRMGLVVRPLMGLDGEKTPGLWRGAWRRAQVSWALMGFPHAVKCLAVTPQTPQNLMKWNGLQGQEWFLFAEDAVKPISNANVQLIQQCLRKITEKHPGVDIVQMGYRKLTGQQPALLLDLSSMQYKQEQRPLKVMKIVGQKLFAATREGVRLLHLRLLCGKQDFFDKCMHELIRAGVAIRAEVPLAGSRAHYSLVDGGKLQEEEMARPVTR